MRDQENKLSVGILYLRNRKKTGRLPKRASNHQPDRLMRKNLHLTQRRQHRPAHIVILLTPQMVLGQYALFLLALRQRRSKTLLRGRYLGRVSRLK